MNFPVFFIARDVSNYGGLSKCLFYGIICMLTRLFAVDVHLHFERLVRDEQNLRITEAGTPVVFADY